jgi:protein disulfide-isomerase
MRTLALYFVTTAAITGFALNSATAQIPWQENLRTAHAQAQAEGKLLLLHFYSDNCVWCDRLEAGSFQNPSVGAAITKRYVPVKVHGGKNPKLTEMFKVSKFPTDVIVTTEGKTLSHQVSPQEPARYVEMLASATQPSPSVAVAPPATQPTQVTAQPAQVNAPAASVAAPSYAKAAPAPTTVPAPTATAVTPAPATTTAATDTLPTSSQPKANQFVLPSGKLDAAGTSAQLAGARSEGMSLELPPSEPAPTATATQTKAPTATTATTTEPELAMEGFCSVTVIKEDRWVEGNPKFGVIHLGKLYLFSDAEKMQTFLADPVPYTPVLNEIDVVRFFEERVIVPGKREWGLKDPTYNRMFFFADEAAMNHFWNEYERYTGAAIEVMEKAISEANPGT